MNTDKGDDMSDREPLKFEGVWLWHPDAGAEDQPDYLPPDVFGRLAGHLPKSPHVVRRVKAYPSWRAAVDALSNAAGR